MEGSPLFLEVLPALSACRGALLSGKNRGKPVYAASFIRRRSIVLDEDLLNEPDRFQQILVHELFHFAWVRLGNILRGSFDALLRDEHRRSARGELGESAGVQKGLLSSSDDAFGCRKWRDYVCESFCDTAAFLFCPAGPSTDLPLAAKWIARRRAWFKNACCGNWRI